MTSHRKYLSLCLLMIAALLYGPSPALAQSLDDFAALAGQKVSCTTSTVNGDVGVANPSGVIAGCSGSTHQGDTAAQQAYAAFLNQYATLNSMTCTPANTLTGTLSGVTLTPGVYCVDATAKTGTLTLNGSCTDTWTFLVAGALTTNNFTVQYSNPVCAACDANVSWQADAGATLTTSMFIGSILAGADITVTGGTVNGQALAGGLGTTTTPTGAVTLTGATVNACGTSSGPVCGNRIIEPPEECDDGNTTSGDGCSAQCTIEHASQCSDFPCGNRAQNVQVCHIPPGNPGNANTICISPNALDTHFRHGDYCGPCRP